MKPDSLFYLLETCIILDILILFYIIFLKKEKYYRLNRLYLILSIPFALLIPLININLLKGEQSETLNAVLDAVIIGERQDALINNDFSLYNYVFLIFYAGTAVFSIKLLFNIYMLFKLKKYHTGEHYKGYEIIKTDNISAFSFLNKIYINKNYTNKKELDKILLHESLHIKEKHTFDIIITEILQIFMWFNPLIYVLKRLFRENHEFYVDKEITKDKYIYTSYIKLLAKQSGGTKFGLVNQFNNLLILKRLVMLKKESSKKRFKLKYVFVLPVFIILFFIFSCEKEKEFNEIIKEKDAKNIVVKEVETPEKSKAEKKIDDVNFLVVEKNPKFPGGDLALRQFIANNITYPAEAREARIFGTVYLRFVVKKNGEVSTVEIQRGVHELLDNEAIRVIKELPKFIAGEQNGKKVNVWFSIPIVFKLK